MVTSYPLTATEITNLTTKHHAKVNKDISNATDKLMVKWLSKVRAIMKEHAIKRIKKQRYY